MVAAVTVGSVMAVLDTTVINVALQTFSHDLHTPIAGVQWVITGYLLSLGAVIPVSGWAAHRFGARRVFISSIVMFALGSAACGLARSLPELVGFRVLQGIGGGTLLPVGQIILVRSAGPARLSRAMSAMGVPLIMAPVFGPTIGGILLEVSWRLIFYINIPIAAAAVICSFKLLKRDAPERVPNPDVIGLFLGAGGMVGLTYGLAQAGAHPFASPDVLVPLLTGAGLVVLFCVRALHARNPLLDVRLWAVGGYRMAAIAYFCGAAVIFGSMFLLPLYFQDVRGISPVATGLLLLPQGLGSAVGTFAFGRLSDRLSSGVISAVGATIACAATLPFVALGAHTPYGPLVVLMVVRGFGLGMTTMPIMTAGFRAVGPSRVSDVAPQLNVLQRVGASLGVAILAVTLQHGLTSAGPSPSRQAAAFGRTFLYVAILTAAVIVPAVFLARRERTGRAVAEEPAAVTALAEA